MGALKWVQIITSSHIRGFDTLGEADVLGGTNSGLYDGPRLPLPPGIRAPCDPLPLSMCRACDLLLADRMGQRRRAVPFGVTCYEVVTPILQADCLYRLSRLLALMRPLPHGEAHMARNRGSPPATSQQGAEASSLMIREKQNPANSHMNREVDPAPVGPQMRPCAW